METGSNIKRTVMRRVYIMRALRPLTSGITLGSIVFMLALAGIGNEVFVAAVFQNMPSVTDVAAVTRFFVAAFVNTDTVVQLLVSVSIVAIAWLVRDAVRTIGSSHRFA